MPTVGYEYRANDGYSREVKMGVLAGIGVAGSAGMPSAVHGNDTVDIGMLSHIGFHGACANKIYLQRPQ